MHIVTLTFDDGFLKSSLKTAGIFEKFGLSASINIIATGHWKNFTPKDQWHVPMGSFDDWNDLQARGHEIMPHGYMHANKSKLKLAEAQQLILECLSIFSQQLNNFNPKELIESLIGFLFPGIKISSSRLANEIRGICISNSLSSFRAEDNCPLPPSITIKSGKRAPSFFNRLYLRLTISAII